MIRKFLTALIIMSIVGVAGYFALQALKPEVVDPNEGLRYATVERRDLNRLVRFVGVVEPVLLTEVKSEINGRVAAVYVDNGDEVTQGQLLIELDPTDVESEIESLKRQMRSTELRLEQSRKDYARIVELHARDFSTDQERESAETDKLLFENELLIQESQLKTLEDRLSKTRILAPHDGVVLNLDVTPGRVLVGAGSVSQGDVPMEVASLKELKVEAKVSEVDLAAIYVGQDAEVSFASIPNLQLSGRVESISPSAEKPRNPNQQLDLVQFPVRLTFSTDHPRVKPGISAMLSVAAESVEGALVLPLSAVFRNRDDTFVYLVEGDGKFVERSIVTGLSTLERVEVLEGLEEGDEVALGIPAGEGPDLTISTSRR